MREYQQRVLTSEAQDHVVISAPQLGKTVLARLWLLVRACRHGADSRPWWWTAPTYAQVRHGMSGLVRHCRDWDVLESYTSTTPLEIRLKFGAIIEGRSWDNPQGMYGPTVLGVVADEFGWMTGPGYSAISSRRAETVVEGFGHALWIGNVGSIGGEAQRLWELAQAGEHGFAHDRWTWVDRCKEHPCACGVGVTEKIPAIGDSRLHGSRCLRGKHLVFIESEQGRMSRTQFAQLYDAEWADWNEIPAYHFDRVVHVDAERAAHDPYLPVELSCDFNVDPMGWCVGQHRADKVWTIDEIVTRGAGGTMDAAKTFISRFPAKTTEVVVYGDRSGKSRDTRSKRSDYDIIRDLFRAHYNSPPRFEVPESNPAVSKRLNAVNSKLMAADGTVRYWIHPRCTNLIEDRARVSLLAGTHDIDKRNKKRTHFSDADDYRLVRLFAVAENRPLMVGTPQSTPLVDPFIGQRF